MTNAQPEPSMEEILASIRRIISEDEEEQPGVDRQSLDRLASQTHEAENEAAELATATPEPAAMNESESQLSRMLDQANSNYEKEQNSASSFDTSEDQAQPEQDKTLAGDVEEIVEVEISKEIKFEDDNAATRLETEDVKMVKQQAVAESIDDAIIDSTTASAASAAFGNLTRSVRVSNDEGQTLETIVVEMMRPLVKEWLDQNLSRIVEEKVEDEVQRLSRRG